LAVKENRAAARAPGGAERDLDIDLSLAVAWASLATGAATGLLLGLWSFRGPVPVPAFLGEYDELPRRLLRLGHIAFFGLGMLNIMLSRHMASGSVRRSLGRVALGSMNFGNVLLPLTLILAAFIEPAKYLMSLPAAAVTVALVIAAYAAAQRARGRTP